MIIPTEPIGSIPRPPRLIEADATTDGTDLKLDALYDEAIRDTIERFEEVRDRVLEAASYLPLDQLGTTDDCGFAPFCDDTTTTRDTAFEKIHNRVLGTALASEILGGR